MRPSFHVETPFVRNDKEAWRPAYPNPADFRFDYYRLLNEAKQRGEPIGRAPTGKDGEPPTVAVVGAGCAGLTAARELFRAGYRVRIFEASERVCGRHYTVDGDGRETGMELGAMRFPFFNEVGSGNCVLDYYVNTEAGMTMSPFPNPGSAEGGTGIYLNRGYGPAKAPSESPKLIDWSGAGGPDNPALEAVYKKMQAFQKLFTSEVSKVYASDEWETMWQQIANHYERMSFGDLVFTPAIDSYGGDGWFGGLGMTTEESELFYTIGAGDGSWGAFYAIGALWFLRCTMFGFSSNLQTIFGITDKSGLPHYDQPTYDSVHRPMGRPLYDGIQALGEWLLYVPAPGAERSLYDAMHDGSGDVALHVAEPVADIHFDPSRLHLVTHGKIGHMSVDYAIVTPTLWASKMSLSFHDFPFDGMLPWTAMHARDEQHNITSCKVFFPLTETYWETGSKIPQLLVTDTFVQDAYGVKWGGDGPGVLLASYTWEDDASKLLTYSDKELGEKVLAELDAVTTATVRERISDYVDASKPTVMHWMLEPTYRGCSKLYRQRKWAENYALLTFNQEYSYKLRLYFAGEAYSVEGGWTEPALRLALDAAIHLIDDSGGSFTGEFSMGAYPRYDTKFRPDQSYPAGAQAPAAAE